MKFSFLLLIIVLMMSSCAHTNIANHSLTVYNFFEPAKLNGRRTVTIQKHGTECGEWGGHIEKIIIQADSSNNFSGNYRVYSYNCDTAYNLGSDPHSRLMIDTSIALDEGRQQSIMKYIYQLFEIKVGEKRLPYPCDFSIYNSDSSLFIHSRVCNPTAQYFEELLFSLGLKQNHR